MPGPARGDGLDRLWRRIGERLERNGLHPHGRIALDQLTRDERHALSGLLGRPVPGQHVSIDLARLDERIRASGAAAGLVDLVAARVGGLVDRPEVRRHSAAERAAVWASARSALAASGLTGEHWVEAWLDDVRRSGALARLPRERAAALLATAVRVVAALPRDAEDTELARNDLASRIAGDAHALDDGSLLATIVLRAVAAMTGQPVGRTASARRRLWQAAGVQTDAVSTTALTLGLVSEGGDTWLDAGTAAGWESHLTRRDLRRIRAVAPGGIVFVCENPRVLEFVMESHRTPAMVCTHGQPAGVVTGLLDQLASTGAQLRYHGDFDWPGIAIANALIAGHGCVPWRMASADFQAALAGLAPLVAELPALDGPPVAASWDPELAATMASAGRAIHEELVMDSLLADLDAGRCAQPDR